MRDKNQTVIVTSLIVHSLRIHKTFTVLMANSNMAEAERNPRPEVILSSAANAWQSIDIVGACYAVNTETGKLRPVGQIRPSPYSWR